MGWVIGLGIVALVFVLAALGAAPWLAIVPALVFVAALVFVPPFLAARERKTDSGVPSTSEASYDPVTDPAERGPAPS
jgi:membrane protein implicated in regulation of membrane protease activity